MVVHVHSDSGHLEHICIYTEHIQAIVCVCVCVRRPCTRVYTTKWAASAIAAGRGAGERRGSGHNQPLRAVWRGVVVGGGRGIGWPS